ncbi:clec-180 [Pristionchus pacificus]|uniref:Clec-180 protein n=1 Tax=Pristionchus pacificus TaxID=54126 RepID=A0A2A6CBZ8_PRIPA|nr:clec-180 [Pristionchus pacificus]|eukprot:PDM75573.1 clec-180 protein [Pristionchus pacificus]
MVHYHTAWNGIIIEMWNNQSLKRDSDLLGNLERTTLASTENKKSTDDEHKERLESDFNHENELEEMERLAEEVPTPKNELNEGNELDCDEKEGNVHLESSDGEKRELSEEQQKQLAEFLTLLRVFLKTARHDDLRSVIDDHSNMSLIERMKKAIAVAKERETEKQQLMSSMTPSEVEELEKKETASLMSDSEREQVYEEIKNAIKEGIMHDTLDVTTAAPEVIESTTEQSITTVSILEETTTVPTETTTVSIENPTTREGRVRIRIRTLAEVLEEERIEKERAEKEKERIRLSEEKISGAVEKEVKRERDSQIIPLRPLEDLEEINQNEITVATPSRLRFAGVKTFVIENEKKMIPVKDVDSISVLQSEELARKKKSDELRHKLEESLALRAAMRETVRRRNEQLKRKIEEERESYFLSGHRVKRDVYSEEEKKKRDQARNRILEKEEKELEKLRKRLAEVREENEKLEKDLDIVDEISTTTETPKKKTIKNAEKVTRKPSTKTTTDFTTTRPLSAFEKKMDTNHLLNIISKMERERPTMIDRSAVSTMDRVFNNIGQEMHELLVG